MSGDAGAPARGRRGARPAAGRPGGRAASRYLPPQHGAWAFLGLPLALGLVVSPASWLVAVLAVAWVAAYPLSYAALGLVRVRRNARFRRPFAVWLAVVGVAAAVLVTFRPWLVWVGLAYAVLFAVNLGYARRHDERALVNDLVFVAECAAMVVVTWGTAAGPRGLVPPPLGTVPSRAWLLAVACALTLAGSTLHVKSIIRERRDPRYALASRAFAVASLAASAGLAAWWGLPAGWWLVLPYAALAVRAYAVGRRPARPGVLGVVELACYLLLVAAAALAS